MDKYQKIACVMVVCMVLWIGFSIGMFVGQITKPCYSHEIMYVRSKELNRT